MTETCESKPVDADAIRAACLGAPVLAIITAAAALHKDAQIYGMAGATDHPSVRCEVKGLCLKHWFDLAYALEAYRAAGG